MSVEHTKDKNGLDCNCDKSLVVLEGIKKGNRFFSSHTKGEDPTWAYREDRVTKYTAYIVLAYVDNCKEAQTVLFGPKVAESLHLERLRERAKAFLPPLW